LFKSVRFPVRSIESPKGFCTLSKTSGCFLEQVTLLVGSSTGFERDFAIEPNEIQPPRLISTKTKTQPRIE